MCPYRFSRAGLSSDTGVSTLYFVQANGRLELFSTATDARLHVVQGTSELDIPSGCSVESLEVLTQRGWVNISSQGFTLSTVSRRTFVEVCLLPFRKVHSRKVMFMQVSLDLVRMCCSFVSMSLTCSQDFFFSNIARIFFKYCK